MTRRRKAAHRVLTEEFVRPLDEGLRGAQRRLARHGRAEVRPKGDPLKYLHRAERERRRHAQQEQAP